MLGTVLLKRILLYVDIPHFPGIPLNSNGFVLHYLQSGVVDRSFQASCHDLMFGRQLDTNTMFG
ncbi:MAG TPA: hypothetical protein DCZ94_14665 [Lentisphaeria bacterium]|nr:hypothetical protein [Lentisphaeria bacterium]